MPSIAEKIAGLLAEPESFDPADIDVLADDTSVGKSKGRRVNVDSLGKAEKPDKRLRLRQTVPLLPEYEGKKVSRSHVFGSHDEPVASDLPEADELEDDLVGSGDEGLAGSTAAGGFSISNELEREYEKMMGQRSEELEVMRRPSAEDVERKAAEAKSLKRKLEAWGAVVEFRIHLEAALATCHRLPANLQPFQKVEPKIKEEVDHTATEVCSLLASLLTLSRHRVKQHVELSDLSKTAATLSSWSLVQEHVQAVQDWSLGVADAFKERTRLDTRRSFKVLDQSLRTQMQAVAEVEPQKLRQRCTPPPGKHKVFGEGAGDSEEMAEDRAREIFEDRDFYVQLLREALAAKEGLESKELRSELQGRRAAKRQKRAEVERRASKGRKIRYVPIEKLQNFMAPRSRRPPEGRLQEDAVDAMMRAFFRHRESS